MLSFDSISSVALIASVLLLLSMLWMRRRSNGTATRTGRGGNDEGLDTIQAWPPQVVRVMTLPERKAYDVLRRAMPKHLVLAQVPLQRFISVPTTNRYSLWLQRVGRHTVDFLVCDSSSRAIAAVEVRSDDETPRAQARHARIDEVLRTAGLTVHVWNETALPSVAQARLLFKNDKNDELELALGPNGQLPVADMQELLSLGDASDFAPAHDPVSSDYFDDLEAVPARPAAPVASTAAPGSPPHSVRA